MSNGISIAQLRQNEAMDEKDVERISFRKVKPSLNVVDYDPSWPAMYQIFASRIIAALGEPLSNNTAQLDATGNLTSVSHVGSTSVPGLPAKAIIDIDVVVPDITNENSYVPALEAHGFQFMIREKWYQHRFFTATEPMVANVHVWAPNCAEAERHRIFKEWLFEKREERELYARVKREASQASREGGESMMEYTARKNGVVGDILGRALDWVESLDATVKK